MKRHAAVLILAAGLAVSCPNQEEGGPLPQCGVADDQAPFTELAPVPVIQFVLGDGRTCTPGTTAECAAAFDECDVDLGDIRVGELGRAVIALENLRGASTLDVFDIRVEGDCVDAYLEFPDSSDVPSGETRNISVVVNASQLGRCDVELVVLSNAGNSSDDALVVDILSNRTEGGEEGCTSRRACCCRDNFVGTAACTEEGGLVCVGGETALAFEDRCREPACGFAETTSAAATTWLRAYPGTTGRFLAGPIALDGDVAVLELRNPCRVERIAPNGLVVWSTDLVGSGGGCESLAPLGPNLLMVTATGTETLLGSDGGESETRPNEGRTVVAAAVPEGGVTATRSNDDIDFVVRALDGSGARTSEFRVENAQPYTAFQHFVAVLESGDVVLAYMRAPDATTTTIPMLDGTTVDLTEPFDYVVLQLTSVGVARRVLLVRDGQLNHLSSTTNAYALCGRGFDAGTVLELGASEITHATFDVDPKQVIGAIIVLVAADGEVTLVEDATATSASGCAFDSSGDAFAVFQSPEFGSVRSLASGESRIFSDGLAFAWGLHVDDGVIVVAAASAGRITGEVPTEPRFPESATELENAGYVLHVLRSDLGL